jgi:glucose/arabinose dehydrogenase
MRCASSRLRPRQLLRRLLLALAVATALGGAAAIAAPSHLSEQQLSTLELPPGFRINVFAEGLGYVRFMAFSPQGDLLATSSSRQVASTTCSGGTCTPDDGRVFLLPDRDGDGVADRTVVFADGLDRPQGIAFHNNTLYVTTPGQVLRLLSRDGMSADSVEVVVPNLPTGPSHWSRSIAFGPDGKMYVHAGSSCNVCQEEDPRRAAITQYNVDGSGERVFAHGLRNAVGITFHPTTGELWATNNSRDLLGDDSPPKYVSVVRDGDHFGWPFCNTGVPDPDFGNLGDCSQTRSPTGFLPPHSAPLGLLFYTGQQFPAEYRGDLFIALHGSWNRSIPTGYKVVRLPMAGGVVGPMQDFISGWLPADPNCDNVPADATRGTAVCRGNAWGRPVGLAQGSDGSLYVSDDRAGVIYRVTYAP